MTEKPLLHFFITYQDFSAGVQAILTMDPRLRQLKPRLQVQTELRAFDELECVPKLVDRATLKGVGADIIVVSAQGPTGLPTAMRQRIERWAPQKQGNPSAIVALVDPDDSERQDASVGRFLRHATRLGSMDFFCVVVQFPVRIADATLPALLEAPKLLGRSRQRASAAAAGASCTRPEQLWSQ